MGSVSRKTEASIWLVTKTGLLVTSCPEKIAIDLAEKYPQDIYFYAELSPGETESHSEETMSKVYIALGDAGLSERQIIDAINKMQNSGLLFRERV